MNSNEVGCKFCDDSIYKIFVEHIEDHIEEELLK